MNKKSSARFSNVVRATALFPLPFLAISCAQVGSSKIDPSEIHTTYAATYNSGSASTVGSSGLELKATFNVSGSTGTYVELDGTSKIDVDGNELKKDTNAFGQVNYVLRKGAPSAEELQAPRKFTYVANNGDKYENSLTLPGAVAIANGPGSTFRISETLRISWTATQPMEANDSLTLYLEKGDGTLFASSTSDSNSGSSGEVQIESDRMKNATPGNATVRLCRKRSSEPAQAPKAGGSVFASYCSAGVVIALQP